MTIFYLPHKKYNIPVSKIHKTVTGVQLQNAIDSNLDFCGNEESISRQDLKYDIPNNLVIFSKTNQTIDGILAFSVNVSTMHILGLCVAHRKNKIGSALLQEAKRFAKRNALDQIKLTCYGDVHKFYEKNGFDIERHSFTSMDSDDSYSSPKQAFHMLHKVSSSALSKSTSGKTKSAARRVSNFIRKVYKKNRTVRSATKNQ